MQNPDLETRLADLIGEHEKTSRSLRQGEFKTGFQFITPGDARYSEFHGYSESVIAYIGLGSNQGDRKALINEAIRRISNIGEVIKESSVHETDPVDCDYPDKFLNCVVALEYWFAPEHNHDVYGRSGGAVPFCQFLLDSLRRIEDAMGRERPHCWRNAKRTIDLDILLFGDHIIQTDGLVVPHPRMHERWFVLKPLSEICPQMVHPVIGETVDTLLQKLVGRP